MSMQSNNLVILIQSLRKSKEKMYKPNSIIQITADPSQRIAQVTEKRIRSVCTDQD